MDWNGKEYNQEKTLFKTVYCGDCKQVKVCGKLSSEYCCQCYYKNQLERTQEYSNYQQVYQKKKQEKREQFQQLQLLRNYLGCKTCKSLEVDAYNLYENSKLVCQSCLAKKTGGSSSPISFLGQQKWYKKYWKIELNEWLEREGVYSEPSQYFSQLPVNAECAREWLKDRNHLNNCQCLEAEAQETYLLFANSLKEMEKKLKDCQCESSEKVRVDYLDSMGDGWIECQICQQRIDSAGHHGVIKNRNDPRFWGIYVEEKVLCGGCLGKFIEKMPRRKKYLFNEYQKRGYW